MEKLMQEQLETFKSISRIMINLKKLGEANITRGRVLARIDRLSGLWDDFKERHLKLLAFKDSTTSKESYFEDDIYSATEESYLEQMGQLLDLRDAQPPPPVQGDVANVPQTHQSIIAINQLPRLTLPRFSGRYSEWCNFRDLFDSMVVQRSDIPKVQKLQHLKTCLEAEPAQLLSNLPVTSVNFDLAWETLNRRYNNKRLLINSQVSSLFNIKPASIESAPELRRIYNLTTEAIGALKALECPTDKWDILLVFMTLQRLDSQSRRDWETTHGSNSNLPSFEQLCDFIEARIRALEAISSSQSRSIFPLHRTFKKDNFSSDTKTPPYSSRSHSSNSFHSATTSLPARANNAPVRHCSMCKDLHYITSCPQFNSRSLKERRELVTRLNLCFNCLGNHSCNACDSKRRCNLCGRKHNTLLHNSNPQQERGDAVQTNVQSSVPRTPDQRGASSELYNKNGQVISHMARPTASVRAILLATARVIVTGPSGLQCKVRALLDQGSEVSFISEAVAQLLQLPRRKISLPLMGIAGFKTGTAKQSSTIRISSQMEPHLALTAEVIILSKLTSNIPSTQISNVDLSKVDGLSLADPNYNIQDGVGMILGADLYGEILRNGLYSVPNTRITAQNTAFGWILSGSVSQNTNTLSSDVSIPSLHCVTNSDLLQEMRRFWEIEEITSRDRMLSPDDEWCEKHYQETHSRNREGRYIVRIPYKEDLPSASDETYLIALSSLKSLLRRLEKNSDLRKQYSQFLAEYLSLGHMKTVSLTCLSPTSVWYIPHHPVIQNSGMNKKLRVVFDAARRLSSGKSLNDFLHSGPPLQADLSLILLHWRRHKFVFSADIVKMFRQILLHPDDQERFRILWSDPDGSDSAFSLSTVTYGTKCAPYLAIRTLHQLAKDEGPSFPLGAHSILNEMYVDDFLSGADSISAALAIQREIIGILQAGGFRLDKWTANHPDLLASLPQFSSSIETPHSFDLNEPVKTLGIIWIPSEDAFSYRIPPTLSSPRSDAQSSWTKRMILSYISKVFDPLGWIAPVTILAKILMQDLWVLGVEWDERLPQDTLKNWRLYSESLPDLANVRVSRWIGVPNAIREMHLHGFADASRRAYATVIYLQLLTDTGYYQVSLLAAKSRVSPVKTVSIPRLELLSAVLLVRLILHLRQSPVFSTVKVTAWLDSQVALSWIRKHPSYWSTFVANRVSFIQTTVPEIAWNYVPSSENPADLATRGITAPSLLTSTIWWQGPSWLKESREQWPKQPELSADTSIERNKPKANVLLNMNPDDGFLPLIVRFSSLFKLFRVVAYCKRFVDRCLKKRPESLPDFITSKELQGSRELLIKVVQSNHFQNEIQALQSKRPVHRKSPLASLNPFIDNNGIVRVGGRLGNSFLPFSEKHPAILPKDSPLSKLFVAQAHLKSLHGGPSLTLGILLKEAWILRARVLVKAHVRQCMICHRHNPRLSNQLMGELPVSRITPDRPFSKAGLDYAGPFHLRMNKGRGRGTYKGYICLFICLVTKAIHIEAISDATSSTFIAAFRRFCGRRGVPSELLSDNSTTFRGASTELQAMFSASSSFYQEISQTIAKDGTAWNFIPPRAPHFGGLWEAGVRSVKMHIMRVVGDQILTYEEFCTVLVQIEACVNSRPLCPASSNPEDLAILTPGHFLIGASLFGLPEPGLTEVNSNHLSRWQLIQKMYQHFWKRWSKEYLHTLQQRHKWRTPQRNFEVGQLVLIQNEGYPPAKWVLGRVSEIHPGPDGQIRVVTVRTATSTFKRPITRLSALPLSAPV